MAPLLPDLEPSHLTVPLPVIGYDMDTSAKSNSSLREARGGGAVIRDGGVMGNNRTVAHDPSAPSGHLPMLRIGRNPSRESAKVVA